MALFSLTHDHYQSIPGVVGRMNRWWQVMVALLGWLPGYIDETIFLLVFIDGTRIEPASLYSCVI